jgi:hypothetical protein
MVMTPSKPTPIYIQPVFSCFFEHAEYVIELLHPLKDRFRHEAALKEIVPMQKASTQISVKTLDKALNMKDVQRRIRVGCLLQGDLVQSLQKLSVKVHQPKND